MGNDRPFSFLVLEKTVKERTTATLLIPISRNSPFLLKFMGK
jgi:hypothetical protein